ncbi:MAG: DDE-type integrase/transposase/recombinase [Streptosporangiaceae bacterium]
MTTADEAEQRKRVERARETGLFRYSLVQELTEPGLSLAERGWRARELAGRAHEGPGGRRATVSYSTLTRWRRLYESGGFDALVPSPRQPSPRTPEEVLALAEALKRERPGRTAAQVRRILQQTAGWAPSDRTLQRLFERLELGRPAPAEEDQRAFGRFECARPNEMWIGDTLHGPAVGGKKSYLFAFIDDHSRAVMGARWSHHDDVVRMAAGFRPALQARGVPRSCYLDNGSPFVDAWLLRACGVLGVKLIHSRPGKPEGRGKIERFFRTVRDQFLVEIGDGEKVAGLAEMNRLFRAWLETAYHQAVHSETRQAPGARWEKAAPAERAVPEPALLREAFLWSERRKADKTALVRLHGNVYQVDAWLAGRVVELLFDPFDLDRLEVRLGGKPAGTAVPFVMGRHRHPKTRTPDGQARTEPAPTGIDYLGALGDSHDEALREQVSYRFLVSGPQELEKKEEPEEKKKEKEGEGRD